MFCDPDSILKIGLAKLGVFDNFWIFRGNRCQFSVFFQCFFGDFGCFCLFLGVFDCFCVVFHCFLDKFYLRILKQLKFQSSSSSRWIKLDIFGKFVYFLGVFRCFWVFFWKNAAFSRKITFHIGRHTKIHQMLCFMSSDC